MAKNKSTRNSATLGSENEFGKLIKIVLVLIIVFAIFYGITEYVTTHKNLGSDASGDAQEKIASIQYDKVLIGTMLQQKRDEYYVLIGDSKDQNYTLYNTYLDTYAKKDGALKVYTVDLSDPFNKEFIGEEENIIVDDMSDFRVTGITIVKVEHGEITSYSSGKDDVMTTLKELTK